METLVHTAIGELKSKDPVMGRHCTSCIMDLDHQPVPCMNAKPRGSEMCQCQHCIRDWKNRKQ